VYNAVNVTLQNVHQTNCIVDDNYWGTMGGNDVKNIKFDNVSMSRFDVHRQVHNATIINSEIGHQGILVTGSGLLHIENTTVRTSHSFITLREDWGSTWRGDLHIINSTFAPLGDQINRNLPIIVASNLGTFDHGFTCYLPQNIYINGLEILTVRSATLFRALNIGSMPYPIVFPQTIRQYNTRFWGSEQPISIPQFITNGMS
jgi:hypothetical protein